LSRDQDRAVKRGDKGQQPAHPLNESEPTMTDAIVLLKQDHKKVEQLFKQYEKAHKQEAANSKLRSIVDEIIQELSVHASIEETVFYPTVRTVLPDLNDDVLEGIEEHHVVKWTLDELLGLDPDHERFHPKVTVLMESVRHHVEEEEQEMFPQIREGMGRKALQELGAELEKQKRFAPTKPHPKAPDAPPANLVAGPVAKVIDLVSEKVGR
jgi:hemerythrin superfamily protein